MALINLNDTTPAAPSGYQNAKWQADSSSPRNVSAYFPGSGGVLVKTADYTAVAADCGKLIVFNSSSPHTLTLPAAAPFAQWNIGVQNIGAGVVTISPNGLNLDGASSSLTLAQTQGLAISTDATNYFTERGAANAAASFGGVSIKTADYTPVAGDSGKLLVMNSGSAHTITLPSSPPSSTWLIGVQNVGAGTLTVSRGGLTIDTAASDLSVASGQGMLIWCDGSNYFTERSSLPASPSDATKFLNGASSPAFAQVKDSDLSTSDVTTNNVSTSKHGFAPKAPNDATKFLDGTGNYSAPPVASSPGGATSKTASYAAIAGDNSKILSFNSASPTTLTLPSPPPSATWNIEVQNIGSGVLTVSPNGLTLDGSSASVTLSQTQGLYLSTDGSNYFTERGLGTASPLTTLGDILAFSTVPARQGVGANGTCLQADSTQSTGIKWALQPYDVTLAYPGAPPNATVLQLICFRLAVAMSGNFAGSTGHCGGNPTSTAVYTVYKNASPIGTVTIATSGGFTFATTSGAAQSFVAGDTLSILTPAADATLSSVTMTFAGTR